MADVKSSGANHARPGKHRRSCIKRSVVQCVMCGASCYSTVLYDRRGARARCRALAERGAVRVAASPAGVCLCIHGRGRCASAQCVCGAGLGLSFEVSESPTATRAPAAEPRDAEDEDWRRFDVRCGGRGRSQRGREEAADSQCSEPRAARPDRDRWATWISHHLAQPSRMCAGAARIQV